MRKFFALAAILCLAAAPASRAQVLELTETPSLEEAVKAKPR